MAFKLKGSSFYGSPLKQTKVVPKPKKSTVTKHGQLNDAQAEYEADKKLYAEYLKKKNADRNKIHYDPSGNFENEDRKQEIKEDKEGKDTNIKIPKVMKDDGGDKWKNRHAVKSDVQKKVDAKKKEWENATPEQRRKMQKAANDKADKFHKRGKYAVKKK